VIAEVIRLTLAEWYKLRRRWLLWILLGVSILISQAFVWGFNTAYHVNEETFGALFPSYEYRSEDGIIELTCGDVAQGRVEEKLAPLSEAELGQIAESLQEWQSTCSGYTTPEETRQVFTLPYAITATSEGQLFPIVFSLILGAAVVGAEYGFGTLRSTLTLGVGRLRYLAAKLIIVLLAVAALDLASSLTTALGILVMDVVPPDEGASLIASDAEPWRRFAEAVLRTWVVLLPYVSLGALLAVLTQSTAQAISFSMAYYFVEVLLLGQLFGLTSWLQRLREFLLSDAVGEWMLQFTTQAEIATGAITEQPNPTAALFIMLGYTAVFIGATVWLFLRRDVAGAKGE
jgi:ABC-type transport system involved in multi-copper enzyme maturation permease subunit